MTSTVTSAELCSKPWLVPQTTCLVCSFSSACTPLAGSLELQAVALQNRVPDSFRVVQLTVAAYLILWAQLSGSSRSSSYDWHCNGSSGASKRHVSGSGPFLPFRLESGADVRHDLC